MATRFDDDTYFYKSNAFCLLIHSFIKTVMALFVAFLVLWVSKIEDNECHLLHMILDNKSGRKFYIDSTLPERHLACNCLFVCFVFNWGDTLECQDLLRTGKLYYNIFLSPA